MGGGRGLKWVLTGFEEIAGTATTQVSPCSTHLYSTLNVMARTITGWAQWPTVFNAHNGADLYCSRKLRLQCQLQLQRRLLEDIWEKCNAMQLLEDNNKSRRWGEGGQRWNDCTPAIAHKTNLKEKIQITLLGWSPPGLICLSPPPPPGTANDPQIASHLSSSLFFWASDTFDYALCTMH